MTSGRPAAESYVDAAVGARHHGDRQSGRPGFARAICCWVLERLDVGGAGARRWRAFSWAISRGQRVDAAPRRRERRVGGTRARLERVRPDVGNARASRLPCSTTASRATVDVGSGDSAAKASKNAVSRASSPAPGAPIAVSTTANAPAIAPSRASAGSSCRRRGHRARRRASARMPMTSTPSAPSRLRRSITRAPGVAGRVEIGDVLAGDIEADALRRRATRAAIVQAAEESRHRVRPSPGDRGGDRRR